MIPTPYVFSQKTEIILACLVQRAGGSVLVAYDELKTLQGKELQIGEPDAKGWVLVTFRAPALGEIGG